MTLEAIAEVELAFSESPMQARQRLQHMQRADSEAFLDGAVEYLKGATGESAFANVLIRLLRDSGDRLDRLLFHPTKLSVPEAAKVVRLVCRSEASYQALIAEQVKMAVERRDLGILLEDVPRLIDVLAESIDGNRLLPLLTRFSEHSNERLRSKAVLWLGRLAKRGEGGSSAVVDSDPRVRANAVEALWGRRDEEALAVLRKACADAHHRVVGNALYGLYLAGDISAVRQIARMVDSEDPLWKMAGIWLLGKTEDPRFLQMIQMTTAVATGKVRSALLKAGRTIKQRKDRLLSRPPLRMDLVRARLGERGQSEIGVVISEAQGVRIPEEDLLATNFIITDGTLKVDFFRMQKRCGQEAVHVSFLVPLRGGETDQFGGILQQALERSLGAKRRQDYWAVEKYRLDEREELRVTATPSDGEQGLQKAGQRVGEIGKGAFAFSAQADILRDQHIASTQAAHESPEVAVEAFANRFPLEAKRRHVVLLRDPNLEQGFILGDTLSEKLSRQGIVLHVVNVGRVPAGELAAAAGICAKLQGFHVAVPNEETLGEALERLLRALSGSFDFSYELGRIVGNTPSPRQAVQIECYSDYGYGRLCIDDAGNQVEGVPAPGTGVPGATDVPGQTGVPRALAAV